MDVSSMLAEAVEEATGVPAYCEVPPVRPDEFVVVERTGGPRTEKVIDSATMAVDCWSKTRGASAKLAEKVSGAIVMTPETVENVFGASIVSTYNNPDLDSGTPRTSITCEVVTNL